MNDIVRLKTQLRTIDSAQHQFFENLDFTQLGLERGAKEMTIKYQELHRLEEDMRMLKTHKNRLRDLFWVLLSWILTILAVILWLILYAWKFFRGSKDATARSISDTSTIAARRSNSITSLDRRSLAESSSASSSRTSSVPTIRAPLVKRARDAPVEDATIN